MGVRPRVVTRRSQSTLGEVAGLLTGRPVLDVEEQAFPFITIDPAGRPHVALLSRAELEPAEDRDAVLAVTWSPHTTANLQRHGRATLLAVDGTVCHSLKLDLVRSTIDHGLFGCVFRVADHKRDTLGAPLHPLSYRTTPQIAHEEHWENSARALRRLAHGDRDLR